jgi:hypothetical protein
MAAARTQTREGARHRRLARRRGTAKACVATGNTQLKVSQLLADPGMRYADLGPDYYERQRDTRRQIARHAGTFGAPGFEVTLCRTPGTRPGRNRPGPGRLTHTAPAGPDQPRSPGPAAARPANLHFSGQKMPALPHTCHTRRRRAVKHGHYRVLPPASEQDRALSWKPYWTTGSRTGPRHRSKLVMRVRFPSPAPTRNRRSAVAQVLLRLPLRDYEPPAGYGVIFRQGSVQGLV